MSALCTIQLVEPVPLDYPERPTALCRGRGRFSRDSSKRRLDQVDAGGGGGGGADPLIRALIQKLPKSGEEWSADDRVTWLQMISMAFQMTYGPVDAIEIKKKQG
jgi:hypothetical protein